ncbi:RidA family protein [Blastococcus sp. SYSU D00669]
MNACPWSLAYGFDQAEVVEGASRVLVLSGQAATAEDGSPQHLGDLAAQCSLALDDVETVLLEAGMTLGDVVRIHVFATDVDAMLGAWRASRSGSRRPAGRSPARWSGSPASRSPS